MKELNKEIIYKNAIMNYGAIAQIDIAIEEMSELIQALSKYKRCKKHNVEEEIADVQIMLDQLNLIFNNKEIDYIKKIKIERLEHRLQNNNSVEYVGVKNESRR